MSSLCLIAASISAVFALGLAVSRRRGPLSRTTSGILACAAVDFLIEMRYYDLAFAEMEPKPWLSLMALYGILIARLYRFLGDLDEKRDALRFLPMAVLLPALPMLAAMASVFVLFGAGTVAMLHARRA